MTRGNPSSDRLVTDLAPPPAGRAPGVGRYAESATHPGEWVCSDCPPPTGQRVSTREGHDLWHQGIPAHTARQ